MGKFIDLTGQRFGRLVVIEKVENKKKCICWKCLCDCGNEIFVLSQSLTSENTKSCGCLIKTFHPKNNLIGKKFGKWTVIEFSKKIKGIYYYKCKCECGNQKEVGSSQLINGRSKSCGCLQKEIASRIGGNKIIDLTKIKFGKLIVLRLGHRDKCGNYFWLCKCDCGVEKEIRGTSLRNGNTISCGCYGKEKFKNNIIRNKLSSGEANFNVLYSSYRYHAELRKLSFTLTKQDFKFLTKQNCYYCNVEPHLRIEHKRSNGYYLYNGIDRINNNFGYNIDNVISCCKICNQAKHSMSQQDFLQWVERVYNHSIRKEENKDGI